MSAPDGTRSPTSQASPDPTIQAGGKAESPPDDAAASPSPEPAQPVQPHAKKVVIRGGGPRAVRGEHGMVVSVEEGATHAGVRVLEEGGNAIDAAAAVAYALAVTHPSAGNLGGGGFMLIHPKGGKTVALDFRERAPLAIDQDAFDRMIAEKARGPAAVGVPGSVAGLNRAHRRFGRLPLDRVLAPAIALARDGHPIGPRQAKVLQWAWPQLKKDPEARTIFGTSKGPKRRGAILRQTALAKTLERIARHGDAGFYTGETAAGILAAMKDGGLMTAEDLASYRPVLREPLTFDYLGLTVQVAPPPSAGGVAVARMLRTLQHLEAHRFERQSAQELHLFVEVARRAHATRRFHVVDPDSVPGYDLQARIRGWLDAPAFLKGMPPIDPERATPSEKVHELYPAAMKELENTTHLAVIDAEGNAVTCTTTLSAGFGAKIVAPGVGVVLNNSVAAFGTVGDDVVAPGRRMTSSMSPTLVLRDGEPVLLLGSPGGDTIPNTVVQVLRNVVDHSMTIDEAVDAPRIHHGFVPDEIRYEAERPLPSGARRELAAKGHRFSRRRISIGDANNVLIDSGVAWGYADPREGGLALGPAATPARLQAQAPGP